MISKLMGYIAVNLDDRLKDPFVSKDYTSEEKEHLLKGLQTALECKEMSKENIIEIHKLMNPDIQKGMRFSTRRGGVGIPFSDSTEGGLLETLNWLEAHQAGYGPRFTIYQTAGRKDFTRVAELREAYGCKANDDLALKLELELKDTRILHMVPIFDSLNPAIDWKSKSPYEPDSFQEFEEELKNQGYLTYDTVAPKFVQLIDEFNKREHRPSLVEIAGFIKSMILLHPFPDGNGRTFVLGVLNQLLYMHNYGLCLYLNPYTIAFSTVLEIADGIKKDLVPLKQFELKLTVVESGVINSTTWKNNSIGFFQNVSSVESKTERCRMPVLG